MIKFFDKKEKDESQDYDNGVIKVYSSEQTKQ